jgi:predicted ATPase
MGRIASQHDRKPLRSNACQWGDGAGRARRRTPNVAAALVPGKIGPGTSGPSVRRSGDWQIEAHYRADGTPSERTANAVALFLFAAAIDSPFYPIMGRIERAAGFTREDTPADKLNKLDAMLARNATSPQDASLLAEMLSLPNDGRYPVLDLTPQQRRERTVDALTTQLMSLTSRHTVLMIFEDAHWSDPSTLEMLGRTVKSIANLPVLFVVTHRPEFEPTWIGQSHVTTFTINRLGRHEVDIMIDNLAADQPVAAGIRQDIIDRSDGVPLFVEEVTKAVLEANDQIDPGQIINVSPSRFEVPATLQASLMARLDRLGAAKEVAQVGAAIGREFSYALLAAVVPQSEPELQLALNRLVAAGLLFRQGVPPQATYLFKHALVQDAAEIRILPGSGHWPFADDPDAVAQILLPFLRRQLRQG